jgi:hypothetical protein
MAKKSFNMKQLGGSIEKSILYNRAVLYFIFFLTLGYLFFLLVQTDYYTFAIFILIGFLTSFFSKNMIVILSLAMSVSFIFKYGTKIRPEGYEPNIDLSNPTINMTPTKAKEMIEKYKNMVNDGVIKIDVPMDTDGMTTVDNKRLHDNIMSFENMDTKENEEDEDSEDENEDD